MGKKIDDETIKYILDHINDRPRTLVAKNAGVSLSKMYNLVRKYGGNIDHSLCRPKENVIQRMIEMFPTHTAPECAKALGISRSSAVRWSHRLGLVHNEETEQRIIRQRDLTLKKCRQNIDTEKRARTWKRRRKMDELRVLSGQEQKTKFRFKFLPRRLYLAMYYLSKQYGYSIIDSRRCEMMRPEDWGEEKYYSTEKYFGNKYKIIFYDYVDETGDSSNSK